MKLQHPLISKTNDTEMINIEVEYPSISIKGDGWSITILKEGLATVIHTYKEHDQSHTQTVLNQPTYKEVRAKVRDGGRAQLTDLERTIMDITKSIV